MKSKHCLNFIFALFLSACQTAHIGDEERSQIEAEIKQSVTEYAQALTKLDLEKIKNFYAKTEDVLLSVDGKIIAGQKEVDEFLNNFAKSFKQMSEIETNNIHIALLSQEAAAFTMEFRWRAITQQDETLNMKGTATFAMKKSDGKWRTVHLVSLHTPVTDLK